MQLFIDRTDAGKSLAKKLILYRNKSNTLVLALRKQGLPVAAEVSRALNVQLEIFLLSKIKSIKKNKIAIGSVASGGIEVLNNSIIEHFKLPKHQLNADILIEKRKLITRQFGLRGNRPYPDLANRNIILIDDGMIKAAKARAAVAALKKSNSKRIIFALPIIDPNLKSEIEKEVDQIISVAVANSVTQIPKAYENFAPVATERARAYLT
jgi:putative phosphoribosyl transferase